MISFVKRVTLLACAVGALVQCAMAQPPDRGADDPSGESRLPLILPAELKRSIGGPTLITLHLKNVKPQAALDEFIKQAKQGGVEVRLYASGQELPIKEPVTLDITAQPFWQALQTLAPKIGVFPSPWNNRNGITLAAWNNPFGTGLTQMSWPGLIVAREINRTQVFTQPLGGNQPALKHENLRLSLSAFIDPKVRIIQRRSSLHFDEVVDEKGHSLIQEKDVPLNAYNNAASPFFQLEPVLAQPAGLGKRIARLRAALRLGVVAKQETWEVPDILQAKGLLKTVDDKIYTVESAQKNGDNYVVRLGVSSIVQMPNVVPNFEVFGAVRLLDAQGHEYSHTTTSNNGSEKGITAILTFSRPPEAPNNDKSPAPLGVPTKLIWDFPTEIRTAEVPVEFNNLPLP
ncbi:MAG: hypothetical protein JO316_01840 [Abitibacteriaceae bacterium]|nr:hypothetical protein [Abditibacteriaceae bacterium]MBV9864068.1 hypothetical protein [Abditibacteriaceae bacterium]